MAVALSNDEPKLSFTHFTHAVKVRDTSVFIVSTCFFMPMDMTSILFWVLIILGSGLFIYFVPYRNIKIVQKLQKESLEKLDIIMELLKKN